MKILKATTEKLTEETSVEKREIERESDREKTNWNNKWISDILQRCLFFFSFLLWCILMENTDMCKDIIKFYIYVQMVRGVLKFYKSWFLFVNSLAFIVLSDGSTSNL